MRALLLVPVLLLGGCSCSRQADADDTPPTASAAAVPATDDTTVDQDGLRQQLAAAAQARAMSEAVATLHAYLGLVASKEWSKADAYWTGGKAPPRKDDFAVRSIEELRSMRIENLAPKTLDEQSPTAAVEIPVSLRVDTDDGVQRIDGWYRLKRRTSGEGWEISSASMRPSLD